jgi:hypothetical protein
MKHSPDSVQARANDLRLAAASRTPGPGHKRITSDEIMGILHAWRAAQDGEAFIGF